jgi:diacylglycerol kinase (ATP)
MKITVFSVLTIMRSQMNILIIGNPISSGGHAGKRMERLGRLLEDRGHNVTTYLTRYAGDGKEHVEKLGQGMDRTVVVGGDGTLNEIINGLPTSQACPILHFPTGNANLLAQDLKLPQKTEAVADLVENGKIVMADCCRMNGHRFVMVCGMGFDARVTEELKKVRTGKVSNLSYIIPFLRACSSSSNVTYRVTVDDLQTEITGKAVLVANVRNYAGICEMAHDAGICTETMDIVVLPRDNLLSLLKYLTCARFSRISRLEGVTYLKAKKTVVIRSDEHIPVELDGDFFDRHREVVIHNQPGSLPLIVPPGFTG